MKAIKLTSHATAMNLVIEFPGNRVVPRQRFRPRSQFLMGTASEEGTETFVAHRQVVQDLQHIEENRNRHREQHNGLERTHHLEQRD